MLPPPFFLMISAISFPIVWYDLVIGSFRTEPFCMGKCIPFA
ncbi:MAG: hypothetical protein AB8W21_02240 [Coxiella endosymbiont of Dermacentor silvarum]